MISALLNDRLLRNVLTERVHVEVPQGSSISRSELPTLVIDVEDIVDWSSANPFVSLERRVRGMISKLKAVNIILVWAGRCDNCGDPSGEAIVSVTVAMEAALRYVAQQYPKIVEFTPCAVEAWLAGVHLVSRNNSSSKLLCTRNPHAFSCGVEVCVNVCEFLDSEQEIDLEVFSPATLQLLVPGFTCPSNVVNLIGVEYLMESCGCACLDAQRETESSPHAAEMLRQICNDKRALVDPSVQLLLVLHRVADAVGSLPIITTHGLLQVFPSLQDSEDVRALVARANARVADIRHAKTNILWPIDVMEQKGVLQDAVRCCAVGPWVLSLLSSKCFRRRENLFVGVEARGDEWWQALRLVRVTIIEVFADLLRLRDLCIADSPGADAIMISAVAIGARPGSLHEAGLQFSKFWPKHAAALDRNELFIRALAVWQRSRTEGSYRSVGLPLHAVESLTSTAALHPAVGIALMVTINAGLLREWQWTALLSVALVRQPALLSPKIRCSEVGLFEARDAFLLVYEHLYQLNELLNGAMYGASWSALVVTGRTAAATFVPPSNSTWAALISACGDKSLSVADTQVLFDAYVEQHSQKYVFVDSVAAPHLVPTARILTACCA